MSVRDAIYRTLAADTVLNAMLARSTVPGMGEEPAIYEAWASEDTPFPYINITWTFGGSPLHWVKRQGVVTFDIFMDNADTVTTEDIARRIIELLDHQQTHDPEDGYIETYLDGESDYIEDEPEIVHYTMDFRADHWRETFIKNREVTT